MNKKTNKNASLAITFYVFSVLLLIVCLFTAYYAYEYIKNLGIPASDFKNVWKDVVNVYVTQCTTPFVGAVVCYGIGCILSKLGSFEQVETLTFEKEVESACGCGCDSHTCESAESKNIDAENITMETIAEEVKENQEEVVEESKEEFVEIVEETTKENKEENIPEIVVEAVVEEVKEETEK